MTDLAVCGRFSELLAQVHNQGDQVVITHSGQPMAVLIDFALFERIQCDKTRFQQLSDTLGQKFSHFTEEAVVALVEEAIQVGRMTQ
jgi:prevent-host-death family protein